MLSRYLVIGLLVSQSIFQHKIRYNNTRRSGYSSCTIHNDFFLLFIYEFNRFFHVGHECKYVHFIIIWHVYKHECICVWNLACHFRIRHDTQMWKSCQILFEYMFIWKIKSLFYLDHVWLEKNKSYEFILSFILFVFQYIFLF
jgi:hypothetical protein